MVSGAPGFGLHLYRVQTSPSFTFIDTWSNTGLAIGFDSVTVGNFGGTGTFDDILITDDFGSFLYLATGTQASPFNANVWVRNDLNWRNTEYVAGDWTGDGLSDLWIINPSGTFGYKAQTSGTPLVQQ